MGLLGAEFKGLKKRRAIEKAGTKFLGPLLCLTGHT